MREVDKKIISVCTLCACLFLGIFAKEAEALYRSGDHGSEVEEIQLRLKNFGYEIESTGIYDDNTVKVVKAFQEKMELSDDGIVGEETFRKLMERDLPPSRSGAVTNLRRIVSYALSFQGVPYYFGGTTPNGFDCSGFTRYIYANAGINLPRMADQQYNDGRKIQKKDLFTGDLVYFETYTAGVSHVGIYLGGGQFISATSSAGIAVRSINDSYWGPRYVGATRIL